jgi:hypothetical protein
MGAALSIAATAVRDRDTAPGLAAIALGVGFNAPYALLAATYDYPAVLRRPAGEALARFAEGGAALILTWHAFAWAALLLAPLALALALTPANRAASERLALSATLFGALSGVTQAMGLWRWVFAVPGLGRAHAEGDPAARAAAERAFDLLNAWGGVAVGEHLGQLLLAMFALCLAALQWRRGLRRTAATGLIAAAAIAAGTTGGLALALGRDGAAFSTLTIAGFLGLTLWLVLTGLSHLRAPAPAA